jgi:hypothetical protein
MVTMINDDLSNTVINSARFDRKLISLTCYDTLHLLLLLLLLLLCTSRSHLSSCLVNPGLGPMHDRAART